MSMSRSAACSTSWTGSARRTTQSSYIFGDNGSSAEGQKGSISELLAQNNIPTTVEEQLVALDQLGGLDALGSPKTDNMYHAGWAWAGSTPFHHTKLVASHFGGTRNPMAISWPRGVAPDPKPRNQFHHVNDIAPTIYEILGITHPEVVDGHQKKPLDGFGLADTFDDPTEPTRNRPPRFRGALTSPECGCVGESGMRSAASGYRASRCVSFW
jgi:arylsulfatase A-like enzyme